MNTMTYRGYNASVEFDDRDNILVGRVVDIADVIGFHAATVADLRTAFEEAIDDYLETCAKLEQSPNKPFSGKLMLRIPPEVHGAALAAAKRAGTSLNKWAAKALDQAAHATERSQGVKRSLDAK